MINCASAGRRPEFRRQRRAWPSSGYVLRHAAPFVVRAFVTTQPGWTSATGLPRLDVWGGNKSGIECELGSMPNGKPFATTSMRRSSAMGTSRFMSARRTWRATLARPFGTHALFATACSRNVNNTTEVARAAWWSPCGSSVAAGPTCQQRT